MTIAEIEDYDEIIDWIVDSCGQVAESLPAESPTMAILLSKQPLISTKSDCLSI